MLSIANVGGSRDAGKYYEKADDYYTQDRSPSQWQGKAAEIFKLTGEVKSEDFKKLLDGFLPNGDKIHVPEAGRRGGTDLTFSAPKSVSMQAFIGGDLKLIDAHDKAVNRALKYAETLVTYRQTENGETTKKLSQNMVAATFRHELSRACDPQLHTHSVILNITRRDDGQWRAIDNEIFYRQKMLMGAFYRAELAREVQKLGYTVRILDGNGLFELSHITETQIEAFSQRSQAIEKALEKDGKTRGTASPEEKQIITIATRPQKTEVDRKILREYWQSKSREAKIDYQPNLKPQPDRKGSLTHLINTVSFALEHGLERQSVITQAQILRDALQQGVGKVTYGEIRREIERRVQAGLFLKHGERFTTPEAISREKSILSFEKSGRGVTQPVFKKKEAKAKIKGQSLNQGQKNAALHILTSKNQVIGVQGLAGTGKTFMLQLVNHQLKEKGLSVIGLAPSAGAAEELSKTGISSQTIQGFQATQEKKLSSKTVLVVDESGMVSSAQMDYLLKEARQHHARVVLMGDTQQLKAVEAGRPFAQLQVHGMATAGMSEIQRQLNPDLKKAVELAARGQIHKSVGLLHKSVLEIKKSEERYNQISKDYASLPQAEREKTLVVSGTNEARKAINQKIRENLGVIGKGQEITTLERKDLTKAQMKDGKNYSVGDIVQPQRDYSSIGLKKGEAYTVKDQQRNFVTLQKPDGSLMKWKPNSKSKVSVYLPKKQEIAIGEMVRVTQNDRKNDLVNGDRAKVTKINGTMLHCQKEGGKVFKLDVTKPLHLEYGYCSTVHSAQGKTCKNILIEADTKSLTTARDSYYVAISRARNEAKIYTNDKTKLPEAMSRRNEKEAALELSKG